MVDVSHYRHHRRSRNCLGGHRLRGLCEQRIGVVEFGSDRLMPHLLDDDHRRLLIQHLIDRYHRAELHQSLDDLGGFNRHLVCEISNSDRFGHRDLAHDRLQCARVGSFGMFLAFFVPMLAGLWLLPSGSGCSTGNVPAKFERTPARSFFLEGCCGRLARRLFLLGAGLRRRLVQRAVGWFSGRFGLGRGLRRGLRCLGRGCNRFRGLRCRFFRFFLLLSLAFGGLLLLFLHVFLLTRNQFRSLARLFLARSDFCGS